MPIEKEKLEQLLGKAFPEADIELTDMAGDNDHWQVSVTSPVFAGKNRIAQHKMVQNALAGHDIHALSIKTVIKQGG